MKIVYVNDAVAIWGGLERLLVEKMNLMVERLGYEVHLVTESQGSHPFPYPLHPNIIHTDLGVGLHETSCKDYSVRIQLYYSLATAD